MRRNLFAPAAALVTAALLLSGCAASGAGSPDAAAETDAATTASPRLAVTYDGGIAVIDAASLDVIAKLPIDGFTRVNSAGDDRTVLVTTDAGFRILDTGASTAAKPELTDHVFPAAAAGHAVPHAGTTALFDDATGDITLVATKDFADADGLPESETVTSPAAHHGVAIRLADGSLYSTLPSGESRTGVRHLDADGEEISRFEQCPGVHGEGALENDTVVFGCENGVLIVRDGEYTKLDAPDAFGRTGNIFPSEESDVVLGDYNADPDAEGYVLTRFALADLATDTLTVHDLPAGVGYTFRDLGRGPAGEVLILGTDGALHVIDPQTGEVTASHPVVDAWEGPAEWQDAHPALKVVGGTAYVTDPAAKSVHAVDLATGEVTGSVTLPAAPNEIAATA